MGKEKKEKKNTHTRRFAPVISGGHVRPTSRPKELVPLLLLLLLGVCDSFNVQFVRLACLASDTPNAQATIFFVYFSIIQRKKKESNQKVRRPRPIHLHLQQHKRLSFFSCVGSQTDRLIQLIRS
jgi:hypothetical protein